MYWFSQQPQQHVTLSHYLFLKKKYTCLSLIIANSWLYIQKNKYIRKYGFVGGWRGGGLFPSFCWNLNFFVGPYVSLFEPSNSPYVVHFTRMERSYVKLSLIRKKKKEKNCLVSRRLSSKTSKTKSDFSACVWKVTFKHIP